MDLLVFLFAMSGLAFGLNARFKDIVPEGALTAPEKKQQPFFWLKIVATRRGYDEKILTDEERFKVNKSGVISFASFLIAVFLVSLVNKLW